MNQDIKIKIVSGQEMNESWQPDTVKWPENSICVCAYDGDKLKGRVGMIILPHMEGFWVTHDQLATGLAQAMEEMLLATIKAQFGATHALTFTKEKANGLARTIENVGWKDEHLKVFSKEL